MARKPIQPLSERAREQVMRTMDLLGREGYAIWGFIFASQTGAERIVGDGKDFVAFEVFNNAGEDSIPAVIAKTEAALVTLRTQRPLGVKIEDDFARVLREVNKHRPEGSKLTFDPHKTDS